MNDWGGKEWANNVMATMIGLDSRNIWRLRRWMMEYDRVLVVFNIILSSEQMEIAEDRQWRASLAKKLIDASGWEFGCLLSQIGTETVDTSTGAVVSIIHESMVDVRTKRGGEKGREVPRSWSLLMLMWASWRLM